MYNMSPFLNQFHVTFVPCLYPYYLFYLFFIHFSPSSLPEQQGPGGDPGRAGAGEETPDSESVHEHTWSQVREGQTAAMKA